MKRRLVKTVQWILMITGSLALILVILALTPATFWIRYNLGTKLAGINRPPEYIVVLGGGGMPSESGLMRCWYAAGAASKFPKARVILALPGDTNDPNSSINGMKNELILRGVAPERILFEDSGTNTRAEALLVKAMVQRIQSARFQVPGSESAPRLRSLTTASGVNFADYSSILLVTSPEHLYRSVLTFKKTGFLRIDGIPAFEKDLETDLAFSAKKLGGKGYVPDVGGNITLRYKFWTHLRYEMELFREYTAIAYYWVMGWI